MPQVRVASVMATQLWRNAEIVTMDAAMPRARALVVRDGLVDFVGDEGLPLAVNKLSSERPLAPVIQKNCHGKLSNKTV